MARNGDDHPGRQWLASQLPSWLALARLKQESVAAGLSMDPGQFARQAQSGRFEFADLYAMPTDITIPLVTTWAAELGILTVDGMLRLMARALVAWTERPATARMELPRAERRTVSA